MGTVWNKQHLLLHDVSKTLNQTYVQNKLEKKERTIMSPPFSFMDLFFWAVPSTHTYFAHKELICKLPRLICFATAAMS